MAKNKLNVARAVKQNKYLLINISLGKNIFKRLVCCETKSFYSFVLAKKIIIAFYHHLIE